MVGETYLSLRAQARDFLPFVRDIREKQPDVIFSTVVGDLTAHFYKAYAAARLDPKLMQIARSLSE